MSEFSETSPEEIDPDRLARATEALADELRKIYAEREFTQVTEGLTPDEAIASSQQDQQERTWRLLGGAKESEANDQLKDKKPEGYES